MRFATLLIFITLVCASCSAMTAPVNSPATATSPQIPPTVTLETPNPSAPTQKITTTASTAPIQSTLAALKTRMAAARTVIPSATPTPWIQNYAVKQISFLYEERQGGHTYFDGIGLTFSDPRILIYSDGQIILRDQKNQFWEKQLSKAEIDHLLNQLRRLGFFELQTNHKHDPSDPLYHFGPNQYQESADGTFTTISVTQDQQQTIGIYEPNIEFVIPPVKSILSFLDQYAPTGLSPYHPERLILTSTQGRGEGLQQDMAAIPWPADVVSPVIPRGRYLIYLEGKEADTVFQLTKSGSHQLFSVAGKEYTVSVRPIFPHQCPVRVIDLHSETVPDHLQPFVCQ